jgi:FkbM family methyltransferase
MVNRRKHKDTPIPAVLDGQPFTWAEVDVGSFWLPTGDGVMRPFMQRCETWERSTGALLRRLLGPGARFLDVGAGVGYFSVLAANAARGVQVDAVEPNPATTVLLRFNLWLNDVDATVWPIALTDARRAVPLSLADRNIGDTRGMALSTNESYSLVAPGMPADDIFSGRTFDVVKIDVQGWETEVLLGMQRILKESRSIAIVVEFWPSALRQRDLDPRAVLDGYHRMSLDVVTLNGDGLEARSDESIVALCDSAGPEGSVNLLLRHR